MAPKAMEMDVDVKGAFTSSTGSSSSNARGWVCSDDDAQNRRLTHLGDLRCKNYMSHLNGCLDWLNLSTGELPDVRGTGFIGEMSHLNWLDLSITEGRQNTHCIGSRSGQQRCSTLKCLPIIRKPPSRLRKILGVSMERFRLGKNLRVQSTKRTPDCRVIGNFDPTNFYPMETVGSISWDGLEDKDGLQDRVKRVEGWEEKFEAKEARRCPKSCACGVFCDEEHSSNMPCPPCMPRSVPKFGYMEVFQSTYKGAPVEISVTRKCYMGRGHHKLRPWCFNLEGQLCRFVIVVEFGNKSSFYGGATMWSHSFHNRLIWSLRCHGFTDEALTDLYNRLHERTYDKAERDMQDDVEVLDMKDLSPAFKVVIIVNLAGRVKVVGEWKKDEVVMVGDHKLGPAKPYDVMCYGQVHTKVNIRDGEACPSDVFMMVPKGMDTRKLRDVAAEHKGDVTEIAQHLIKLEEIQNAAWVAKFT